MTRATRALRRAAMMMAIELEQSASKCHVAKVEFLEEAFNRIGKEKGVVTRAWNVGIAVTRIVQRVNREVLGKLRDDLFK